MLTVVVVLGSPAPATAKPPEYRVKAEFVERFTRFVDWPKTKLDASDYFVFCVVGDSPITAHLERITRKRRIKGCRAVVRRVDLRRDVSACHVLFVPRAVEDLGAVIARAEGMPILTIADTPGFAQRGVMVNLFRRGQFVGFEINVQPASDAGLRMRSKLVRLGRRVERER